MNYNYAKSEEALEHVKLDDAIRILRNCNMFLKEKTENLKHLRPEDYDHYKKFIENMEALLKEIEETQKLGDEAVALMTPEFRKKFKKKAPGFFSMLGWLYKIDSRGNIIHDA